MIEYIPHLIAFMIAYDISIHLVYALKADEWLIKKRLNWWFNWWGNKYQTFWITYWATALILLIIYIAYL